MKKYFTKKTKWEPKQQWMNILMAVLLTGCTVHNDSTHYQTDEVACHQKSDKEVAELRGISLSTMRLLRKHRSLFKQDICDISDKKLERAIYRSNTPKPDQPDKAIAFRNMQQQDENGLVPENGFQKALEHVRAMRSDLSLTTTANSVGAGIERDNWESIGPGNIGGRIRSILFHPANPDTIWIGSVSGGIWKTTTAGQAWAEVDDFMANLAVSTLAIDPNNSDILYAGTGEGYYNADGIRGAGVFKSTDGGVTWNQLASTANSNWYYVNRLSISPSSSSTLLAATRTGIWRSIDAGNTWTKVASNTNVYDVDFHPGDGTKAIASGGYGTFFSINGGSTWQSAAGIPNQFFDRSEVTYAPSNPNVVYASVDFNGGEIWKSVNGGQSYSLINTGYNYLGQQGWYDNSIWVDPTNANTLIVGGIDLWRSTNGGSSLTKISQWYSAPASAHADHHIIIAHPDFNGTTNKTVYFGNDGGIYRASDVYTVQGTSGWQELNNNLRITQFYGAAGNPTTGKIIGGTQDNGTLLYSGDAENWTEMNGGDGGFCAADPDDPNYFYGEFQYLQIHRSTDGGASSGRIINGLEDAGPGNDNNFISPFILDPNNPNTMLAGGGRLWRSANVKDFSPNWTAIKSSDPGGNISAIAVAKGNSNVIWVGHNNGSVYKTTNGSAVNPIWVRMDNNGIGLPNRYVHRITLDPSNSNTLYVTFGGFSPDNIYQSTDGGLSWSDRTGTGVTGLPDAPVRSLVVSQIKPEYIYAGTEVGIFASEDAGISWGLPHDGPANVSIDELFWLDPSTLVAATHGRGLFKQQIVDTSEYSESLDFNANWESAGDAKFINDKLDYFFDQDSVHSGRIVHDQNSYIETQFTGPGVLSFYWKVSSEANYDFFKVLVNDIEQSAISGEQQWVKHELLIEKGQHTVKWMYQKDSSVSNGGDSSWLDKVEFKSSSEKCDSYIFTTKTEKTVSVCL